MSHKSIRVRNATLVWSGRSSRIVARFVVLSFAAGIAFYFLYFGIRAPVSKITSVPLEFRKPLRNFVLEESLNVSHPDIDWGRLVYNRVSKCGSLTLNTLIEYLSQKLNYTRLHSKEFRRRYIGFKEQQEIVQLLTNTSSPCSYDRHLFFINFNKFGERPPVHINMIREPVERMISFYYYQRLLTQRKHRISNHQPNKTFEDCFLAQDPECRFSTGRYHGNMQLTYFCGQEYRCQRMNDPWAINRAKQNIEKYYAVVGTLEQLDVTLHVLEAVLPQFFEGVYEVYNNSGVFKNKNPTKKEVKEEIKTLLKARLTGEYELYYFVKQRLHRQYQSLVRARQKTEQNEARDSSLKDLPGLPIMGRQTAILDRPKYMQELQKSVINSLD